MASESLSYGNLIPVEGVDRSGIPEEEKIMEEQVRAMIEEAAYFLAQKRNFSPGYELQDWLEAERQIDIQIKHMRD